MPNLPNQLLQMNCLPVYLNSMSYETGCNFSPLLQYTTTIPFSILQSINSYKFCILNVYLPSEATRLKTSITFINGDTCSFHCPQNTQVSIGTLYESPGWANFFFGTTFDLENFYAYIFSVHLP